MLGRVALAAVAVSVPVIGLAPAKAVPGQVVDGVVLALVAITWLRRKAVTR